MSLMIFLFKVSKLMMTLTPFFALQASRSTNRAAVRPCQPGPPWARAAPAVESRSAIWLRPRAPKLDVTSVIVIVTTELYMSTPRLKWLLTPLLLTFSCASHAHARPSSQRLLFVFISIFRFYRIYAIVSCLIIPSYRCHRDLCWMHLYLATSWLLFSLCSQL